MSIRLYIEVFQDRTRALTRKSYVIRWKQNQLSFENVLEKSGDNLIEKLLKAFTLSATFSFI